MSFPREAQLALVASASRSPSPHNTQPARWRFAEDRIELHERVDHRLAAGDPTGRDQAIALGAAWEGMAIALSERGFRLGAMQRLTGNQGQVRGVGFANVEPGAKPDPLAFAVRVRRAYRGTFPAADAAARSRLDDLARRWASIAWIREAEARARIGREYDAAAAAALRDPAFAKELYAWMRFSSRHPDWFRDGLTADCLALSSFEAWGGRLAMRPGVVRVLAALGLAGILVSEAAKVRSATVVALLFARRSEDPFETGRAFYRFWLDLAASGFSAVPMSALADSPEHSRRLVSAHAAGGDMALINVFRAGPLPAPPPAESARLPAEELLLA
jgi:nitroreductase